MDSRIAEHAESFIMPLDLPDSAIHRIYVSYVSAKTHTLLTVVCHRNELHEPCIHAAGAGTAV